MANCGSALALLHIYLVLLEVQLYCMEIIPFKETHVIVKIANYLKILKRCHKDAEIAIVSPRDDYARDIIDYFLDGNSDIATAVLFDINVLPGLSKNLRPNNYYIFVTEFENVIPYLKVINDTSATYLIVICHNVWNSARITGVLIRVWMDYRILRFFLVFYDNEIRVVSYNPFKNETLRLSGDALYVCSSFTYKMSNLYRHTINVSMTSLPPSVVIENGKMRGRFGTTFNIIAEKLNARLAIVTPDRRQNRGYVTGATADVSSGKAEFSLMPIFAAENVIYTQQFTYPHGRDDFIVVTKNCNRIVEYSNIYQCFDIFTWIIVAVLFATVIFVRKFFSKNKTTMADGFIYAWAGLFSTPLPLMFHVNRKIKLVLTSWIMCSLVISTCFNSSLLKSLIKPFYKENINTITELREKNLKIFIPISQMQGIPMGYGISQNLIPVNSTVEHKQIFETFPENSAIVVKESVLEYYLSECLKKKSEIHILEDHLIPGLLIHYFRQRSPFRNIVDEVIHKIVQSGLTKPVEFPTFCKKTQELQKDNGTILTFEHLKNIFKLLLLCHSLATFVFVFEIFIKPSCFWEK